jgi:hypothetical protein
MIEFNESFGQAIQRFIPKHGGSMDPRPKVYGAEGKYCFGLSLLLA